MKDAGIVRSEAKIRAAVGNAQACLSMQRTGETFSAFAWRFVGGEPLDGGSRVRARSVESEQISKALKSRGFKFVGPVVVYAWMQAVGLVNDHQPGCFRRAFLAAHKLRARNRIEDDEGDAGNGNPDPRRLTS